jgi:(1->4)-alpha-D-glucan 1-alpha-D-glucosylmutase
MIVKIEFQPQCRFGATYRLQFNGNFRFEDAAEILPYLSELGVTQIYASPLTRSGAQSTHGYDVCNFDEIDPKLGGDEGFQQFSVKMQAAGLGLLLDIVPNHMRADISNPWWRDVLEKGPYSVYANYFDIDWASHAPSAYRKVLLPILGGLYADILESGQLKAVFSEGAFWFTYGPHRFPASVASVAEILEQVELPPESAEARAMQALIERCRVANRAEEIDEAKGGLRELERSEAFTAALARCLEVFNGIPGDPHSFDRLDRMLQGQNYRLCWWRIGPEQIDYRRFFDITDLVCLNAQIPEVFEASHRLLRKLIRAGKICGLRIDHLDGLWDPQQYIGRVRELWPEEARFRYVVAEKILATTESLPLEWPISGTTGYDFLNEVNGIFVNRAHKEALNHFYKMLTGASTNFRQLLFACRLKLLRQSFPGQFAALVDRFALVAAKTRYGRDFPLESIRMALAHFISAFPVYRNYVTQNTHSLSAQEKRAVEAAFRECRRRAPTLDPRLLGFMRQIMILEFPSDFDDRSKTEARHFIMKLQQLTAPLAAKGLEDTACYRYNRLISLNEVGGNPGKFGLPVRAFHRANQKRARHWPHTLIATATHDTKHGEDARARINVLSEMPEVWAAQVRRWRETNQSAKTAINDKLAPCHNDEYLIYQILTAAWSPESQENPQVFHDRIIDYMLKAVREAKKHTSWTDPDEPYESALKSFISRLLSPGPENLFLPDFTEFARRIAFFGYLNSLSQLLLKATSPGVPDFYQGTELWDLTLVDPDNRRPVDYVLRTALLKELQERWARTPRSQFLGELVETMPTGAIKLYVTWQLLWLRREWPRIFSEGRYVPAKLSGPAEQHLCAFVRETQTDQVIVAAPRLVCGRTRGEVRLPVGEEFWGETLLTWPGAQKGKTFQELFSARTVRLEGALRVSEILAEFPIAVLISRP